MLRPGVYKQIAPVLFGSKMAAQAGKKAKELGVGRLLLVCDEGIRQTGMDSKMEHILKESGLIVTTWYGVQTDCPDGTVEEAVRIIGENHIDGVLGLGGGSVLDTAKVIAAAAANGLEILGEVLEYLSGAKSYAHHPLPLILMPTTAGTGSESTFVAVVTSSALDAKVGLPCAADCAIVDPELTMSVPPFVTAFTGLDALSHANEALAEKKNTPHSDLLAFEVVRLIKTYLPAAVADGSDREAREHLAFASNLAGIAFNESGVHIGHACAHALGHLYHVPHGVCCANLTPAVIELQARAYPEKMKRLGLIMGAKISTDEPGEIGKKAEDAVRAFAKELGIPSLNEQGFTEAQILEALPIVLNDPLGYAYDGQITEEEIRFILKRAYRGSYGGN